MQTVIVASSTERAEVLRAHFELSEDTPVVTRADAEFVSSLPPGPRSSARPR